MTNKKFDCVEIKRRGAEKVQKETEGMNREQELKYWQLSTQKLKKHQAGLKNSKKESAVSVSTH